ncbi:hypothetical protein BD413DRAFT_476334 [Trametes elegans]|nr:hypothetical protein BD413DRAFT_476334 [Trametes elegans]
MEYKHLTEDEVEFFIENGYLVVKEAFSRSKAAEFSRDMWVRLGLDPNEPSTWPTDRERIHMPALNREPVATFAPKVWEIMKELLGGEERIDERSSTWGDSFIVNLGSAARPVDARAPSPSPAALDNWHVDGDFFVHFLDSPEQALLAIPVFSDIRPRGGATHIAPAALAPTARYLAAHPEGVLPRRLAFLPTTSPFACTPAAACPDPAAADPGYHSHPATVRAHSSSGGGRIVELTGAVGDVVLVHPLMPHTAAPNLLRVPRVITNPPVALRAPFRFARSGARGDEYSVVERATLRALGVDRLAFAPTGERRRVVPERVLRERKMREEEAERLEAARVREGGRGA